jgi:hypothetical protein
VRGGNMKSVEKNLRIKSKESFKKKHKEWAVQNIKDYYKLTHKILKMNILTGRELGELAAMFYDASSFNEPKSKEAEYMFAKLISMPAKPTILKQ